MPASSEFKVLRDGPAHAMAESRMKDGRIDDLAGKLAEAVAQIALLTAENEKLGERIINASSMECDAVLDPFCGCGTAVHASQKPGRKWIGIDITHLAIGLTEYRTKSAFGARPEAKGMPITIESTEDLSKSDKYQLAV